MCEMNILIFQPHTHVDNSNYWLVIAWVWLWGYLVNMSYLHSNILQPFNISSGTESMSDSLSAWYRWKWLAEMSAYIFQLLRFLIKFYIHKFQQKWCQHIIIKCLDMGKHASLLTIFFSRMYEFKCLYLSVSCCKTAK